MTEDEFSHDSAHARPFIDAVIGMRLAIKQFYHQRIRKSEMSDLTYEMFQVMVVLWNKREANQQDLANAVQKNKASLTPLIDNLCKRDLVTRSTDANDRRNNVIRLTEKGKLYERYIHPIQKEFYELLLSEIDEEDLNAVTRILNKLVGRVSTE